MNGGYDGDIPSKVNSGEKLFFKKLYCKYVHEIYELDSRNDSVGDWVKEIGGTDDFYYENSLQNLDDDYFASYYIKEAAVNNFESTTVFPCNGNRYIPLTTPILTNYRAELDSMFKKTSLLSVNDMTIMVKQVYCIQCICLDFIKNIKNFKLIYKLKLLDFIWKDLTYKCANTLKYALNNTNKLVEISNNFELLLELFVSFARTSISLFNNIKCYLHKFLVEENNSNILRPICKWMYDMCLYCGDLYRYCYECYLNKHGETKDNTGIGSYCLQKSKSSYLSATDWSPNHPKAYHLLAIISTSNKNFFDSFYYLMKTMTLSQDNQDILISSKERFKIQCSLISNKLKKWCIKTKIHILEVPNRNNCTFTVASNEIWCLIVGNQESRKVLMNDGTFKNISLSDSEKDHANSSSYMALNCTKFIKLLDENIIIAKKLFILHFLYIHGKVLNDEYPINNYDDNKLWLLNFKFMLSHKPSNYFATLENSLRYLNINMYFVLYHLQRTTLPIDFSNGSNIQLSKTFSFFVGYFVVLCDHMVSGKVVEMISEPGILNKCILICCIILDWLTVLFFNENKILDTLQHANYKKLLIYHYCYQLKSVLNKLNNKLNEAIFLLHQENQSLTKMLFSSKYLKIKEHYFGGLFNRIDTKSLFQQNVVVINNFFDKKSILMMLSNMLCNFTDNLMKSDNFNCMDNELLLNNESILISHGISQHVDNTTGGGDFMKKHFIISEYSFVKSLASSNNKDILFENHPKYIVFDTNCLILHHNENNFIHFIHSTKIQLCIPIVVVHELKKLSTIKEEAKDCLKAIDNWIKHDDEIIESNIHRILLPTIKFLTTSGELVESYDTSLTDAVKCNVLNAQSNNDDCIISSVNNLCSKSAPIEYCDESSCKTIIMKRYVVLTSYDRIFRAKALNTGIACVPFNYIYKIFDYNN